MDPWFCSIRVISKEAVGPYRVLKGRGFPELKLQGSTIAIQGLEFRFKSFGPNELGAI